MDQDLALASAKYSSFVSQRFVEKLDKAKDDRTRISEQETRMLLRQAQGLMRDLLPHVNAYIEIRESNLKEQK